MQLLSLFFKRFSRCVSKFSLIQLVAVFSTLLLFGCGSEERAPVPNNSQPALPATKAILVLYDAPPNQVVTKLGMGYAIMLRNLLGHFKTQVDLVSVDTYKAGSIEAHDATFYLGSYFGNTLPAAFLEEASRTTKTLVWFKYNFNQLMSMNSNAFAQAHSLQWIGNRGLGTPDFFDAVSYKAKIFAKNVGDPDIGVVNVLDPNKVKTWASIQNSQTKEVAPYILQSKNFWYVADVPFTFISPTDRYLVICDILFDMLNETPKNNETRALIRFEDVSFLTLPDSLNRLSDEMFRQSIPFSMAVIPFYRDPLGVYSGGVAQEVHLAQATGLKQALSYALPKGGRILMHGYTHQYQSMRNTVDAVSGNDYEFWDSVHNTVLPEDSTQWVLGRLEAGLAEFKQAGFTPFGWETPHYAASPTASRAIAQKFPKTYQRVTYYTADKPNLTPGINQDFALNQFFPYIIESDYYGQRVIPENLGNLQLGVVSWEDLLKNAEYASVVRDGYASFFFHPYLIDPIRGTTAFEDLKKLIAGINRLGYHWMDASQL